MTLIFRFNATYLKKTILFQIKRKNNDFVRKFYNNHFYIYKRNESLTLFFIFLYLSFLCLL